MCSYLNRTGAKYYFRRPVPQDLIGFFETGSGGVRKEWKYSLGVSDREEAKPLLRPHEVSTDHLIAEARSALAAKGKIVEPTPQPSPREQEEADASAALESSRAARYDARKEARTLVRQRMQLSTAELTTEEAAARDLIRERGHDKEAYEKQIEVLRARVRELRDERGVGTAERVRGSNNVVPLMELFEGWARESGARKGTVAGFRGHIRSFIEFSGIEDAAQIELRQIIEWIDWLRTRPGKRGKPLAERTIRTSYLAALRLALSYGVSKLRLDRNAFDGLKLMKARAPIRVRERDFNEEERRKILSASLVPAVGRVSQHVADARRWAPWLCAYTGARIGEVLQLRKCDVRQEDGIWAVHITPQAGDVKTDLPRWVPIHEHLIEQGFLGWVENLSRDRLFCRASNEAPDRLSPAYQSVYNRLREWVRTHVADPDVQPNHAWRHTFKSLAREFAMESEIVDVLQGHRPATVGKTYGGTSMKVRLRELEKLPRFEAGD